MSSTTHSAQSGRNLSHLCPGCRLMHRDAWCHLGVSLTLGSHAVHRGRSVPQAIGGCPYPAADIWCPVISQMAEMLEKT